jgi:serine/threonine-protein kinase PknG
MRCEQPGCTGTIVDGYCDVCGMAPVAGVAAPATGRPLPPDPLTVSPPPGSNPVTSSTRASTVTNRLGLVPLGSARSAAGSRPTRRLGARRGSSRLGAGYVEIPAVPILDPRQALMDPAVVAEDKRYCSVCGSAVGRARDGSPGRTKGFCPKCRTPFDFDPKLQPGSLLGGQYEIVGCLAHGGMGWIYLARDRNVNDRWVVVKGLLNAGDPDAYRAAVAEKQYLAEVEHPLIVEIHNFVAAPDGSSYIIMEYVGGQSLNNLLKSRMKTSGAYSAIPLDQAIAYMIEVLPAFSYLHGLGLLYCDFKPANLIQVGDGIKLIDLGGVRRVDDDVSPIYGTVGFQAPEVPADGTSVASDIYTIARTLAVLVFEFKGYQNRYVDSLPTPDEVPLFAEHDSLYRLLLRATAPKPEDRFQSAEEMRLQLLGVLSEVTARAARGAVTRSTPSSIFETPTVSTDRLTWSDIPAVLADPDDPAAVWLSAITADDPEQRRQALSDPPVSSPGVAMARGYVALELHDAAGVEAAAQDILRADPWDWRGVWLQGLTALDSDRSQDAVGAFNTVYGQLPGELAPKLALARACELSGDLDVADRLYEVCARTDGAYVASALFGRARVASATGRTTAALEALDQIPSTSRAYGESRRMRATLLASVPDERRTIGTLDAAARELSQAAVEPEERAALHIEIFDQALQHVIANGPSPGAVVGGVAATQAALRQQLERAYRAAAELETDRTKRVQLVDLANSVRVRTVT